MAPRKNANKGSIADLLRQAGKDAKAQSQEAIAQSQIEIAVEGELPKPRQLRIFDILTYIESDWGLQMNLFPVQKFIVKLYYNLPLDSRTDNIVIKDIFEGGVKYRFTEVEYLKYLFNEGRCNIGEQDYERKQLILACGRRGGKCVDGETLVATDKGLFRIADLGSAPEDGFVPVSIVVAQEGARRSVAGHFYNGGVQPTVTIRTRCGYTITGTKEHRVKVMGPSGCIEWRYLDEIRSGEPVAIHRSADLWANNPLDVRPFHNLDGYKNVALPEILDERLGNLLGYLVGDGTWGDGHAVSVTVEHPETWEYLIELFGDLFGASRIQMDERTKGTGRLEFCSVRVRRFLDALGWRLDVDRNTKMVPWAILRSPKNVVCAFLRGLFETDGSAESGGRKITFSSASFLLAHEVQLLLLNLGVVSSVRRKWNKKTERHYALLEIRGVRSRTIFAKYVGFDSNKKKLPMIGALRRAKEGKSDTESIPYQITRVRDWLESIPKGNGRMPLRRALGNSCKPKSGEDLTYSRIQKSLDISRTLPVVGAEETKHFEELQALDYFYDPVVTIEKGEGPVFDLTVPDGQSFVANGMTNHNTTLSGIFASYEVYRLLNMNNPQEYYGLPSGNRIQIVSVAGDQEQASLLFNEVASHVAHCSYFKPYLASDTKRDIKFRTPYDIEKFGTVSRYEGGKFQSLNGKATIRVTFKGSNSRGLRGPGNIVIILDEMAHYQEDGHSGAKQIYDALSPSLAAFSPKDPNNPEVPIGPNEGRLICISSPLNRTGKFYDLFHAAMKGAKGMIALQAPTWEMNPTVPLDYYQQRYSADPATFEVEHGANFSDRVRGWIERERDLVVCVDAEKRPMLQGIPRYPYQLGLDVGVTAGGDGTAVAITYPDGDKIALAYHEYWQAGVDWMELNPHLGSHYSCDYARKLKDVDKLDFTEIEEWVYGLTKRFNITNGLFDRWQGYSLEQGFVKRGMPFRAEYFSRDLSSKMFQTVKMLMLAGKLILYDFPMPPSGSQAKHSSLIAELLSLQAEAFSRNLIVVEAPKQKGYHDDQSVALVRSIFLTTENMANVKHVYHPTDRRTGPGPSLHGYQMQRARNHGFVSDRRRPTGRSPGRMARSR